MKCAWQTPLRGRRQRLKREKINRDEVLHALTRFGGVGQRGRVNFQLRKIISTAQMVIGPSLHRPLERGWGLGRNCLVAILGRYTRSVLKLALLLLFFFALLLQFFAAFLAGIIWFSQSLNQAAAAAAAIHFSLHSMRNIFNSPLRTSSCAETPLYFFTTPVIVFTTAPLSTRLCSFS